MTTYFITRHAGAVDWACEQGIAAKQVQHLDVDLIRPGDVVMGTLPVQLAAKVVARGARYLHLSIDVPSDARGRELSADDMVAYGARLQEFHIIEIV